MSAIRTLVSTPTPTPTRTSCTRLRNRRRLSCGIDRRLSCGIVEDGQEGHLRRRVFFARERFVAVAAALLALVPVLLHVVVALPQGVVDVQVEALLVSAHEDLAAEAAFAALALADSASAAHIEPHEVVRAPVLEERLERLDVLLEEGDVGHHRLEAGLGVGVVRLLLLLLLLGVVLVRQLVAEDPHGVLDVCRSDVFVGGALVIISQLTAA